MNLFYCFVFISFSLDSAKSTRISQQSPAIEDREDDLRRTLMYCKSVTVFLQPDDDKKEPHSNSYDNDFKIIGGPLEEWGQDQNSLDVPPYIGGYLSSFEAPVNNLGGQFVNDISNEDPLLGMGPNVVESDIWSVEDPLDGIAGLDVGDLDAVDAIDHSVLKIKPAGRSHKLRDTCNRACYDAVSDSCDSCGCSKGLRHEFRRNCKRACKSEF